MTGRSVLITGCGIVSAIGQDCGQVLDSLLQVRTGVGPLKYLKTEHTEAGYQGQRQHRRRYPGYRAAD